MAANRVATPRQTSDWMRGAEAGEYDATHGLAEKDSPIAVDHLHVDYVAGYRWAYAQHRRKAEA